MKRLLSILPIALALFCACGPNSQEEPLSLSVTPAELSFTGEDTSFQPIVINTNGSWTATPSAEWIHLAPSSSKSKGSVTVSVDANGEDARSATIAVVANLEGKQQTASVTVKQGSSEKTQIVPNPQTGSGQYASTTYQLLVYSFADSNGDGIGDFKGIQNKLDYLAGMGITALWLSPIHPADSYHGYDVQDYFTVSPLYGKEYDFINLVNAAHSKGIKIYIDYVLNHSGKGNSWFKQALADPSSPYRDYYFFSSNPSADYKNFPMLTGTSYNSGEWKIAASGSPKLTVRSTTDPVKTGSSSWNLWMWQGAQAAQELRFVDDGSGKLYLVTEINGSVGMLIRKYMNWDAGSKFGASGNGNLSEGQTMNLVAEGGDISFTGSGRYRVELTDYTTETLYYMGCFSDWMPDLNYGAVKDCESNACFQDLAESADKWIGYGIDGFRLDAVKHICGGISSYNNSSNQTFLQKWYERCNASYKAAGHSDNIYMVGEVWDSHNTEKNYYKGINSCFEFGYWPLLYKALVNQNTSGYVSTVMGFINDHKAVRPDAETALFMTNHDHSSQTGGGEVRAADDLGKDLAKEKQAAAMILTSPGKPYVYQGEELGYWGNSAGKGDEYIRTPILWDKAGKDCAKKGVNNKVDGTMLKAEISVEAQEEDRESLLNVYKTWGRLRNGYKSLGQGEMTPSDITGSGIASWYMTSDDERMLVIHNCGRTEKTVTVNDDMSNPVALLGRAYYQEKELTLEANSSVVFKVK